MSKTLEIKAFFGHQPIDFIFIIVYNIDDLSVIYIEAIINVPHILE